jgi:XTP/dITP diphosphohydrolase
MGLTSLPRIVIASSNAGKIREIRELFHDLPIEWIPMAEVGSPPHIEETGETFQANALLKAQAISEWSGLPAFSDDSGLAVDALDGTPGVRSARFAGPDATDDQNTALLLERLKDVPEDRRTARFHAVVILYESARDVIEAEGTCEGRIALAPAGSHGFGYDPVFIPTGETRTFAQLGAEVKNRISHRARALERLRDALERRLHA